MNDTSLHVKMRTMNESEAQYTSISKKQRKFNLLGPYIACLALILVIIVGIFTIHNWQLYKGLVLSQNEITLDMEKQKAVQQKFLSELTDLMALQQQTHQYSLQELEQKIKKSLEERGYNTAHFRNTGNKPSACVWVLAGSVLTLHLVALLSRYAHAHLH